LGCSSSDSDEIVKKAYRRLVNEYHPDKNASRGLPEEFEKLAADKFREIQQAYEAIRRERGF
jgi:DnaJ like chaperone protein